MDFLSAGTSLLGGALSFFGGKSSQRKQIALAREERDWQEKMSNTAHQREVTDLQAAGLNPILSAGGAGATSSASPMPQVQDVISPAVRSSLETQRNFAEVDNLRKANEKIESDTRLNAALYDKAVQDASYSRNAANKVKADTDITRAQLPGYMNQKDFDESIKSGGAWSKFIMGMLRDARAIGPK